MYAGNKYPYLTMNEYLLLANGMNGNLTVPVVLWRHVERGELVLVEFHSKCYGYDGVGNWKYILPSDQMWLFLDRITYF
jgi:hypothetical protein